MNRAAEDVDDKAAGRLSRLEASCPIAIDEDLDLDLSVGGDMEMRSKHEPVMERALDVSTQMFELSQVLDGGSMKRSS